MEQKEKVFAYIDTNNLRLGIKNDLGWNLDWKKLRTYLKEKYGVTVAYLFIGYIPNNRDLYSFLQKVGFVIIFKPTIPDKDGNIKGNIDADLVLQTMIDFPDYDKAMLITSDGDFYSLVKYLYEKNKLRLVISPYVKTCSSLLRKSAKEKIVFMNNLKEKLEYKRKSTA